MKIKLSLLVVLTVVSSVAQAEQKIVYGDDNRVDIKSIHNEKIQEISKAVAGRIYNYSFIKSDDEKLITFEDIMTLSDPWSANVCKDEKFADQPTVADCTGFLVGEDLLVTAGHCITDRGIKVEDEMTRACQTNSWVFDYKAGKDGKVDLASVDANNVYTCKSVMIGVYTKKEDYAVVKLDRKVTGRTPLKLRKEGKVKKDQNLFVVGHPSGLPMKFADGAKVFEIEDAYFSTNLDTFGGNSGSPVFNADTFEVEGILVRGDTDYITDIVDGERCRRVNTCSNKRDDCKEDDPDILGEHVTHISRVLNHVK